MFERYDESALKLMGTANHIAKKTNCSFVHTYHLWLAKYYRHGLSFASISANKKLVRQAMSFSDHIRIKDDKRPFTQSLKDVLVAAAQHSGSISSEDLLKHCQSYLNKNDRKFLDRAARYDTKSLNPWKWLTALLIILLLNHSLGGILIKNRSTYLEGNHLNSNSLPTNYLAHVRSTLTDAGFKESSYRNSDSDLGTYTWENDGFFAYESISISIDLSQSESSKFAENDHAILIGNLTTTCNPRSNSFWLPYILFVPSLKFSNNYHTARELMLQGSALR